MKERIKNNIEELKRIEILCERFSGQHGISHKIKFDINLVLEEIITNIIKYAYQDDKEHFITVSLKLEQNRIIIIVEDEGRGFNPAGNHSTDLNKNVSEMPVGELGLHLVKQKVDGMEYHRIDNKNILKLKKFVNTSRGNS